MAWNKKWPLPTKREYQIARYNIAKKMIRDFRYLRWMSDSYVVGPNGERILSDGTIEIPVKRQRGD